MAINLRQHRTGEEASALYYRHLGVVHGSSHLTAHILEARQRSHAPFLCPL
jgi:hypothetical protein